MHPPRHVLGDRVRLMRRCSSARKLGATYVKPSNIESSGSREPNLLGVPPGESSGVQSVHSLSKFWMSASPLIFGRNGDAICAYRALVSRCHLGTIKEPLKLKKMLP